MQKLQKFNERYAKDRCLEHLSSRHPYQASRIHGIHRVDEGFWERFKSNYKIKNSLFKELIKDVDCPIGASKKKTRNTIYKTLDEYVTSQTELYIKELQDAKEEDAKSSTENLLDAGDTSRFGALKSKRLAEKAASTLNVLKSLVKSANVGDAGDNWVKIVFDFANIAIIKKALEEADGVNKDLKSSLEKSLEAAQNEIEKSEDEKHENNVAQYKKAVSNLKKGSYSINDYSILEKDNIKDSFDKLFDGFANESLDSSEESKYVPSLVSLVLASSIEDADLTKSINDYIEKDSANNQKVMNMFAYRICDAYLTQCAKPNVDKKALSSLKDLFNKYSIGKVTNLMNRILTHGIEYIDDNIDAFKEYSMAEKMVDNFNKYFV